MESKPKRGRPSIEPKSRRNIVLRVYADADSIGLIDKKRGHQPRSAWIWGLVLDALGVRK